MMKQHTRRNKRIATVGACLGLAVGGVTGLHAQSTPASAPNDDKIKQLEQQNQDLQKRLDALEAVAQKEGLLPSGKGGDPPVSALTDVSLSGFVTTSYFHDSSEPQGNHISPGYLWNRVNDSFSINKFKLTLASPAVVRSGDKFDVGYRVSLIAGQDAPIVNSKANVIGFDYLREAYLEMNIPIGTGLNVKAGELISLLNYESGDGGAANINFSQGFQWFFTGNGPATGVELGYTLCDYVDVKARVQNGLYAGPIDNNSSKTFMGAIDIKPMDKLFFNLIFFGGREDAFAQSVWGGSLIGGWQATDQLTFGTELDYFGFHNPGTVTPGGSDPVWSAGLWTAYDFTKQIGLGLRTEFLSDHSGVDASGGALGFINPPGQGQDLTSVALTLNYKPLPRIKIQPEVRFDHTSFAGGFVAGKQNRVIFGAGATYIF